MPGPVFGFYMFGALASQPLQQLVKQFAMWEEESMAPSCGCESQTARDAHLSAAVSWFFSYIPVDEALSTALWSKNPTDQRISCLCVCVLFHLTFTFILSNSSNASNRF